MSNNTNTPSFIEERIDVAIKLLKPMNVEHDFGENALQYFEDWIEFDRDEMSDQERKSLYEICGAYLGESICRTYNGKWVGDDNNGWGVQIEGSTAVINVFGKVEKWLESGATGDSFVGLYHHIPELIETLKKTKKDDGESQENLSE